jgi:AcrR family transcriptional regulator
MATPPKGTDRRVQRTRQVIREAFLAVVREKGLMGASVREVTERANVSRGTFYAHYADKYELVDAIIREEFQRVVGKVPLSSGWNRATLFLLIQTTLEFFRSTYQQHHRSNDIAPLLERAIREEMNDLLLALLRENRDQSSHVHIPLQTISQIMSWTIFGAAVEGSQKTSTIPSEKIARDVTMMIMDGITPLGIDQEMNSSQ